MEELQPLVLCMENAAGEEVSLSIEANDDFQILLDKAKSVLGYEIDLTSLTKDQTVNLHDNAYQFLMKLDLKDTDTVQFDCQDIDPNGDQLYVLDDGTQIRASQIHFDNEDDPLDITLEKLPFVKITDDFEEPEVTAFEDVNYKIAASPVQSIHSGTKHGFITTIPFRLVCNNTIGFEAQFTKYLEQSTKTYASLSNAAKKNKSPRSLIKDNFNDKEFRYTREEILNILKDSPVTSIPYEVSDKKHVRKTDPTRMVQKSSTKTVDIEGLVMGDGGNKNCFICGMNVKDKIYIFDKEDQKIHRRSPQKKSTQLKVICEKCLNENFKASRMKGANQFLNSDEYLVIRNNQQYIFQKTRHFKFREEKELTKLKKDEFVKVEIGSDGEIVTKPIDNDDVIIVNKHKDSSSDVEIIEEPELDKIIDNLEEADDDLKDFLGKYECGDNVDLKELKCRFCECIFSGISGVIDHGETHKHETDDDIVYPCPLCDYGYPSFKWLRGHIKAAHQRKDFESTAGKNTECEISVSVMKTESESPKIGEKRCNNQNKEDDHKMETETSVPGLTIKTEVKQESISSDDEIWIVQTADDEASGKFRDILQGAGVDKNNVKNKCYSCSEVFPSKESLTSHKCRRVNKRKSEDDDLIRIPSKEDFIRRAQGRPRNEESTNNVQKQCKKSKESSESQVMTCHHCNQSFTSKVRLKFHMQFHDKTSYLTSDGKYTCPTCETVQFNCEAELFDHIHFQHHKQRRWQCPVQSCSKTFYLRATLTKHSRTHTDTRRYVCVTCGKRFLDKQTLDEHGVTHLQIKPYQCHICLKQLTRVSRLRMHVRAHQQEPAPARLPACKRCCRAFADIHQAQEHATKYKECVDSIANDIKEEEAAVQLSPTSGLVRHTIQVIESPEPSKRIRYEVPSPASTPLLSQLSTNARRLIRIVEIDKAFRCEYCEDVFYIEDGLNKHREIHKGVKNPFTCHICKVTFATYSRCTTHKTTHGFYKRPAIGGTDQTAALVGYGDFPTVKHFLCEDCGRSYLHWTYLQVHRRMKHPNENYLHKCIHCEMTFPNSWSLAYHRKKLHTKPIDESSTNKSAVQNYRIPCRDCDEVLPNKTALYKHRKKEHSGVSVQNINANNLKTNNDSRNISGRPFWARPRPHTAVIEVQGLNPSAEEVMNIINKNSIPQDRVIEITMISCGKGTTSIVPNSMRALSMLSNVPRTRVSLGRTQNLHNYDAHRIYKSLCGLLVDATLDHNAGLYLAQTISFAIQRGNAASILGTLPTSSDIEQLVCL